MPAWASGSWYSGAWAGTVWYDVSPPIGIAWKQDAWYSGAFAGTVWADNFGGSGSTSITAEKGDFALTGQNVTFRIGYRLIADTGTYTYTGDDALRDILQQTVSGSYALSGQDAILARGQFITAAQGSYSLNGQSASFLRGYHMDAQFGAYLVVGYDVNFPGGKGLVGESGSYTLAGQDASFLRGLRLPAETGVYALLGKDAGLDFGNTITAEVGNYALTGEDAALSRTFNLLAETGYYHISGQIVPAVVTAKKKAAGQAKAKKKQERIIVEIDGEEYLVGSTEEAQRILNQALERARAKARAELDKALESRQRPSRVKSVVAHKLRSPEIKVDASAEFLSSFERKLDETRQQIREIYDDALRTAEIGILLRRQQEQQEDEDFMIGLFL